MSKPRLLLTIALPLLLADCATKRVAVERLEPANSPHNVIGSTVRLTLAYNPRGAMGLPAGPYARWSLVGTTLIGLLVLARLLSTTLPRARARAIGLALLIGGASGNLLSRLSDPRGVVDFLDLGVAGWRFWTFNVADIGITCGALLLGWALWRSDSRVRRARPIAGVSNRGDR